MVGVGCVRGVKSVTEAVQSSFDKTANKTENRTTSFVLRNSSFLKKLEQ